MMSSIQDNSHTFIARFWLESREIKNAKPIWRGVIEHVASGQRRYLQDLDEVKAFVASYLQGKGIMPQKKLAGQDLK
jgi:hypothetical protein